MIILANRWPLVLALLALASATGARVKCPVDLNATNVLMESLTANMDKSADPCDDFYQYVCGKYEDKQKQVAPDPTPEMDAPGSAKLANITMLANIFRRSCATSVIDIEKRLEFPVQIRDHLLREPIPSDWIEVQARLGTFRGKQLDPDAPAKAPKNRNIFFNLTTSSAGKSGALVGLSARDIDYFLPRELNSMEIEENVLRRLREFSCDLDKQNNLLRDLGHSNKYNQKNMTLGELNLELPNVNWTKLIAGHYGLSKDMLNDGQIITVTNCKAIELMHNFLHDHREGNTLRDWAVYKTAIDNIGPEIDHDECNKLTQRYFSPLYMAKYKNQLSCYHSNISEMARRIVDSYAQTIKKSCWTTKSMKQTAINKLRSMTINFGYSDVAFNKSFLVDLYQPIYRFQTGPVNFKDFNQTLHNIFVNTSTREAKYLSVNHWEFNAYYKPDSNSVNLLTALIKGTYSRSWPSFANYGRLGNIIAHEITHGFDEYGIGYDGSGNKLKSNTIWQRKCEKDEYQHQLDRLVKLYDNQTVPGTIRKLNGRTTLMENTADSGQVAAYHAYKALPISETGSLPGLEEYTPAQLFWIASAGFFCGPADDSINEQMVKENHSPRELRVNIPMMLLPEFRHDFKCGKPTLSDHWLWSPERVSRKACQAEEYSCFC